MSRPASRRAAGLATAMAAVAMLAAPAARAATFCVSDASELSAALWTARTNGEADHVRLREGVYPTGQSSFAYDVEAVAGGDDHDIEISGGWKPLFQLPCGVQSGAPGFTLLSGSGLSGVLSIVPGPHADVTIRGLTLHGGNRTQLNGEGAGLNFRGPQGYSGTLRIERVFFSANMAWRSGGLHVSVGGAATVQLIGNVFLDNAAVQNVAAAQVVGGQAEVVLANNTVLGNVGLLEPGVAIGGLRIFADRVLVANNLMWDQDGVDLDVDPTTELHMHANMIAQRSGAEPLAESGSLPGPPAFSPDHYLTPALGSPLVDAGVHPRAGAGWSLTSLDIRGNPRVNSGTVDIGAAENVQRVFADGYEGG